MPRACMISVSQGKRDMLDGKRKRGDMNPGDVIVHERVGRRHPELSNRDVIYAWRHPLKSYRRARTEPTQYAAVGFDPSGRLVEMCAVYNDDLCAYVIYHAMEATPKMMHELSLDR